MCAGGRDESMYVEPIKANQDARKLYAAGERRLGTDESCFNAILASQNHAQLRMVFDEYRKVCIPNFSLAFQMKPFLYFCSLVRNTYQIGCRIDMWLFVELFSGDQPRDREVYRERVQRRHQRRTPCHLRRNQKPPRLLRQSHLQFNEGRHTWTNKNCNCRHSAVQTMLFVSILTWISFNKQQTNDWWLLKGFGTRDSDLIRLIVTRCEVDMADIRNAFEAMYKMPMVNMIKGDCSGAYKDGLIALVNGNWFSTVTAFP